jgi:GTP cyclohydrolase I
MKKKVGQKEVVQEYTGLAKVERGMEIILLGLQEEFGLDINSEHFKDTPKRVMRSYAEIFKGLQDTPEKIKKILSTAFTSSLDEMVIVKNIEVFSMCPHHFLPVHYSIAIAYIPAGKVLGLSKLPRVAELLAQRPVVQEDLTQEIAEALMTIEPKGVAVTITGDHNCMRMRGVKQLHSSAITTVVLGVFRSNPATRNEFLGRIKD